MSHMKNEAHNQMMQEFFDEMRDSADYKVGYLKSAVNTAIWFLERGKAEQALDNLKATAELMKDKPSIVEVVNSEEDFAERKCAHDRG